MSDNEIVINQKETEKTEVIKQIDLTKDNLTMQDFYGTEGNDYKWGKEDDKPQISDLIDIIQQPQSSSSSPTRYPEISIESNISMSTPDKPYFDELADPSKGYNGYDSINIYNRNQNRNQKTDITLTNDGPDDMYIIVTHDSKSFSDELHIYPKESFLLKNIYEVRLRSPHQGNKFRLTEFQKM